LAALGVLLGNTGTFMKTVAIVAIMFFIVIIAIQILSYYTFSVYLWFL
jgi:preprotein translocase subunit SecG